MRLMLLLLLFLVLLLLLLLLLQLQLLLLVLHLELLLALQPLQAPPLALLPPLLLAGPFETLVLLGPAGGGRATMGAHASGSRGT